MTEIRICDEYNRLIQAATQDLTRIFPYITDDNHMPRTPILQRSECT